MKLLILMHSLGFSAVAVADNCGSLSDCFPGFRGALAGLAAFGISAVVLSNYFDSLPFIGDVKGVVESITGKSVVDGSKISLKDRLLGIIPLIPSHSKAAGKATRVEPPRPRAKTPPMAARVSPSSTSTQRAPASSARPQSSTQPRRSSTSNSADRNADPRFHELFKSEPNEAVFWSGYSPNVGSSKSSASKFARENDKSTLEQIVNSRGTIMADYRWYLPESVKVWEDASRSFAKGASGEVKAFVGSSMRPGNIWERIELPTLKANPNVTKITEINTSTGQQTIVFERL